MFSNKKKALAMSVLCAIASVGFVMSASAEETMTGQLKYIKRYRMCDLLC